MQRRTIPVDCGRDGNRLHNDATNQMILEVRNDEIPSTINPVHQQARWAVEAGDRRIAIVRTGASQTGDRAHHAAGSRYFAKGMVGAVGYIQIVEAIHRQRIRPVEGGRATGSVHETGHIAGQCADLTGGREDTDPVIAAIRHIEIAVTVKHQRGWFIEAGVCGTTIDEPGHHFVHGAGQSRDLPVQINLTNQVILGIRHVHIAGIVQHQTVRLVELCHGTRPIVEARRTGARQGLDGPCLAGNCRTSQFAHAVVVQIRNIDVLPHSRAAHGDPNRIFEAGVCPRAIAIPVGTAAGNSRDASIRCDHPDHIVHCVRDKQVAESILRNRTGTTEGRVTARTIDPRRAAAARKCIHRSQEIRIRRKLKGDARARPCRIHCRKQ